MSSSESDPKPHGYKGAAKARRARKDVSKSLEALHEPRHVEEVATRPHDGLNAGYTGAGFIVPGVFNAALWSHTARMDAMKSDKCKVTGNLGNRDMMERHMRSISLSPSIHGNVYGVLGSS